MQETSKSTPTKKILVLISVIAFALVGWLVGHILRFSISTFRHPPIQKNTPQIQNGFEFEGIRREAVWTGELALRILPDEGTLYLGQILLNPCVDNTYYTSLPAKCRSTSGELVQVGGDKSYIIRTPGDK